MCRVLSQPGLHSDFLAGSVLLLLFAEAPVLPHFTPWSWNKHQKPSKLPISVGLSFPLRLIPWCAEHARVLVDPASQRQQLQLVDCGRMCNWSIYRDKTEKRKCCFYFFQCMKSLLSNFSLNPTNMTKRDHFVFTHFVLDVIFLHKGCFQMQIKLLEQRKGLYKSLFNFK